jgi:exosome complex exonuclease DIS3/RRP44
LLASLSDIARARLPSTHSTQVRKRNASAYTRLRALCDAPGRRFFVFANEHREETAVVTAPDESPNDRNDRAIRVATAYYARVCPGVRVVLLTQDAACRAAALAEGLTVRLLLSLQVGWGGCMRPVDAACHSAGR